MMYRSHEGDVLDLICRKHYGAGKYSVEAVLNHNPGLAEHGPVLPRGVLIDLPEELEVTAEQKNVVRLWG
ncbi:tail protein X [Paracoccaceae bacterium GXU_MW_L88]